MEPYYLVLVKCYKKFSFRARLSEFDCFELAFTELHQLWRVNNVIALCFWHFEQILLGLSRYWIWLKQLCLLWRFCLWSFWLNCCRNLLILKLLVLKLNRETWISREIWQIHRYISVFKASLCNMESLLFELNRNFDIVKLLYRILYALCKQIVAQLFNNNLFLLVLVNRIAPFAFTLFNF